MMKIKTFPILCVIAILLIYSCSDSDNDTKDAETIAPSPVNSPESTSNLDSTMYSQQETPISSTDLVWDFSDGKEYNYIGEMSFVMRMGATVGDETEDEEFTSDSIIRLVFKSQPDGTAKVFSGLVEKAELQVTSPEESSSIRLSEVGYLNTNGSFYSYDPTEQLLTMLFLPIDSNLVEIGDSTDVQVMFPYKFAPMKMEPELKFYDGVAMFTLIDYVEIDGEICAEIDNEISVHSVGSYEGYESEYQCTVDGTSKIYFSNSENRWKKGELTLSEEVNGWLSIPEEDRDSFGGSEKMDYTINIDMWVDIRYIM